MSRSLAAVMSPSARKEPGAWRGVEAPRSLIAAALARHEVGSPGDRGRWQDPSE
ncbi:MAG: hypothetical protein R3F65_26745 [bacterium]